MKLPMKSIKYSFAIILCLAALYANAQTKTELEETYKDANSYFYFEDYEEALALFLQVYRNQPDNANLNYKIGFCYLNIPGSKEKSIQYLKRATQNTTKNYREESILETKAPVDAIFYLGNAYFVNNQIDNALAQYKRFAEVTNGKGQWNFDYLTHQINAAKNSTVLQKNPVNFLQVNLGEPINDRFSNFNAVLSGDGKTMAYTTKRRFYQAVFISNLTSNGDWSTPKNITLDLQVDGNCSTLSLSYDGTELYLFKDDNHDGNIYVSRLRSGKWTPMVKLNKNINSESYETHAGISPDGKYLYFTSNRKGGYGDLDIYVSERTTGDDWGVPRNLGPTINTSLNENTPFLSTDGTMLYFSSEGHNNIGGYDIFISQLNSKGEWSTPINLGYPINTTDDNLFYFPIGNGSQGLISIFDNDGFGEQDICQLELFIPKFMKNIVSSTSFAERTTDNNYKRIVVDTINSNGVALMDITYSDIPLKIETKKRYKLFFEGKSFDIKEKPQFAEKTVIKGEQVKKTELPTSLITQQKIDDTLMNEPIQERINLLKQFSDTNANKVSITNIPDTQKSTYLQNIDKKASFDYNKLSEILLILSPSGSQPLLTKVLKREWIFEELGLNEKIIEFTQAFESVEEKDAILISLAALSDKIGTHSNVSSKRSKNISSRNAGNSLYYAYNQIVNSASPELSRLLAEILVNNPKIHSFEELIQKFKKTYPDKYSEYLPELLRLLAKVTINNYLKLSDEQKFDLYNNIIQPADAKSPNWWIYIIIAFLLTSAVGYLYIREKKSLNH